jgi:hypothetical protein
MYQGLYPVGVKPRIFGARTTAPLFPITRDITLSGLTTSFKLTPGYPAPKTGTPENGLVVARPGDERGYMLWGPYSSLKEGTYRATFRLAAKGAAPTQRVAAIEVSGTPPSTFFARKELRGAEVGPNLTTHTLEFRTPGGYLIETRVFYFGNGTVKAGPVEVTPIHVLPARSGFPDWLLALIWVGGTILAGAVFVVLMNRSTRRPAGQPA